MSFSSLTSHVSVASSSLDVLRHKQKSKNRVISTAGRNPVVNEMSTLLQQDPSHTFGMTQENNHATSLLQDQSSETPNPWSFFPQGAKAGRCLHEILEKFVLKSGISKVKTVLKNYGYPAEWASLLEERIEAIFQTPLSTPRGVFRLCDADELLPEVAFSFPASSGEFQALPAGVSMKYGMIRGVMDLVVRYENSYYIIDWKSNDLGDDVACYLPENLEKVMQEHSYFLQAEIYEKALRQYLKLRMSDEASEHSWGGVLYLFVRGLSGESNPRAGVYCSR